MRFVLVPVFVLLFSCTTILRTREEVRIPERTVALTFDDGPSETAFVDERLLDLLQEKHLKECFCLLTSKVPGKGALLTRILAEGHTIAFHSRNHEFSLTKSFDHFQSELAEFRASRGGIVFHSGSELFPRPTARDYADERSPAIRAWVPGAVRQFVEGLSEQGFRFVGVDELDL